MTFRRRQRQNNFRVNLTPLIDTVFLLLIFFMMTTTFNRESQLNIDLPEAKAEGVSQQENVIRIIINSQGEYAINDLDHSLIDTQLETLTRALKEAAGEQENPPLLLSADEKAPHHAVMKAMEAARDLGFVRLRFEAQQRPENGNQ
jgi:biopolymer transport protein ExbD